METKAKLLNAFSAQMLELTDSPVSVKFSTVGVLPPVEELESVIGHADLAKVLGVEMNRANISLKSGDVAYIAQLTGGRLPEGATELPEGFSLKFVKVEVL